MVHYITDRLQYHVDHSMIRDALAERKAGLEGFEGLYTTYVVHSVTHHTPRYVEKLRRCIHCNGGKGILEFVAVFSNILTTATYVFGSISPGYTAIANTVNSYLNKRKSIVLALERRESHISLKPGLTGLLQCPMSGSVSSLD